MNNHENIALQLWSVRDALERDQPGTFKALKAGGYNYIESATFGERTAEEFSLCAKDCGLEIVSAHIPYTDLANAPEKVVETIQALNCKYAILPWLDDGDRQTQEDWGKVAQVLNHAGAILNKADIQLCYHNHDFEFRGIGDFIPYDFLLENTDPALVGLEVDLGWVHFAGANLAELLNNNSHRIPILHMKDLKAKQDNTPHFVPLGDGDTPFKDLMPIIEKMDIAWFMTEQDECESDSVECAIYNLDACGKLLGKSMVTTVES